MHTLNATQVPSIMHTKHFFIHQLPKTVAIQPLLYQNNTQSKVHVQTKTKMRHHTTTKSEPHCALGTTWRFQTTAQRCTIVSYAEPQLLHLQKCPSHKYVNHSCNCTKNQPIMLPTSIHTQFSSI